MSLLQCCGVFCFILYSYGIAEIRNGRPYMEDRITACGSFLEAQKKKNALSTLADCMSNDLCDEEDGVLLPPPPMIGVDRYDQVGWVGV